MTSANGPDNPNAAPMADEPPYPSNFYAWYCVIVLVGIYLNSFLDRTVIGLLVGPIGETMDLSDSQIGFLMGPAFAIFYTVAGLPLGWLADRKSRKIIIMVGQIFWSLASVGFAISRTFPQVLAARIAVGVGEASLSPSAYSLITDTFRPHLLARALSVYGMGIFLGTGLANLLGGFAIAMLDAESTELRTLPLVGEIFPWQILFLIVAMPTIPLTILLLFTVKEPTRRGVGMERAPDGSFRAISVPIPDFLRYAWKNRGVLTCHHVGFAMLSFSAYGAGFWMAEFFVRRYDWERSTFGMMSGTATIIFGVIGIFLAGWLADRLTAKGYTDAKLRVGLIGAVCWLPFGVAMPMMPEGWMAFALLIPMTVIGGMPWGISAAAIQEMMPNQMRGQASGLYLFVINLVGLGLGPFILPLLSDHVFSPENIHLSILATTVAAHAIAIPALWIGMSKVQGAIDRRDEWLGAHRAEST